MGPERHDGALTEPATEIDRAVQAALAVEPSPEFVARVRRRVANEHEPAAPAWRWPWRLSLLERRRQRSPSPSSCRVRTKPRVWLPSRRP